MHYCPLASIVKPTDLFTADLSPTSLVLLRLKNYSLCAVLPHQSLWQSTIPLLKELLDIWSCFNKKSLSFSLHQLLHYSLNKATLVCGKSRIQLNVRVTSSGRVVEHLYSTPTWQNLGCHCFKFILFLLHWAGQKLAKVNMWWMKWLSLWDLSIHFSFLTIRGWLLWRLGLAPVLLLKAIHSRYAEMPLLGNQQS